jgi:S-(hydroxymethyl)glutathione dehydrogenase/alcohol dehydrogenase
MKARAAISVSPATFRVTDIALADPQDREVVVEVRASGLCASDRFAVRSASPDAPMVAGHEFSGVVLSVGGAVRDLRPGAHVVGCLVRWCGACAECVRGEVRLCLDPDATLRPASSSPRISAGGRGVEQSWGLGGFASHVLVDERQLVALPEHVDLPFEQSCLLGCSVLTGVGTVLNAARPPLGASVAVLGIGGIGLSAIQGLRATGATTIVALDVHAEKLEAARAAGATHVVNASDADAARQVRAMTRGRGVDIAIEASGVLASARTAIDVARNGGTVLLVGLQRPGAQLPAAALEDLILAQRTIVGVSMGESDPRRDIPALAELASAGRLDLRSLVSSRIGLDEVEDGYRRLSEGSVIRTVITRF